MSRYQRTQLNHLYNNETTALQALNKNFKDIEDAINDTVSRSGNTPTHMTHSLDMNGQRLINMAQPVDEDDAVRKRDVDGYINEMKDIYTSTTALVNSAQSSATLAITKAGEANDSAIAAKLSEDKALEYELLAKQYSEVIDMTNYRMAADQDVIDAGLSNRIDTVEQSSDVVDVVGTKANLNSYDTTKLTDQDIVKVLADESANGAETYYRWVITNNVGAWVYVGAIGPFYTKTEIDTKFQVVNSLPANPDANTFYFIPE